MDPPTRTLISSRDIAVGGARRRHDGSRFPRFFNSPCFSVLFSVADFAKTTRSELLFSIHHLTIIVKTCSGANMKSRF